MADEAYTIEVCKFFYPNKPPTKVTDDVKAVAAKMLWAAIEKSKALDFVPRPPGTVPGISWFVSQAVQIFWRKMGKQKIYEMARAAVALQYRSIYEMALAGV
jgi:hypothetical protein